MKIKDIYRQYADSVKSNISEDYKNELRKNLQKVCEEKKSEELPTYSIKFTAVEDNFFFKSHIAMLAAMLLVCFSAAFTVASLLRENQQDNLISEESTVFVTSFDYESQSESSFSESSEYSEVSSVSESETSPTEESSEEQTAPPVTEAAENHTRKTTLSAELYEPENITEEVTESEKITDTTTVSEMSEPETISSEITETTVETSEQTEQSTEFTIPDNSDKCGIYLENRTVQAGGDITAYLYVRDEFFDINGLMAEFDSEYITIAKVFRMEHENMEVVNSEKIVLAYKNGTMNFSFSPIKILLHIDENAPEGDMDIKIQFEYSYVEDNNTVGGNADITERITVIG